MDFNLMIGFHLVCFRYKPNSSFVRLPTIRRPNLRDVLYKSSPPPAPSAICSSISEAGRDGTNDVTGKWLITVAAKNSSGYLPILTVDTLVAFLKMGYLLCLLFFYADDEEEHLDYVQLTQKHKVAIRAIRRVNYQESHVHNKILNHRLKACNLKQHRIHTKYILLNGRFSLHFGEPNLRNILIYNCR